MSVKIQAPDITATGVLALAALAVGGFLLYKTSKVFSGAFSAIGALPDQVIEYVEQVVEGVQEGFEDPSKPDSGRGNKYGGIFADEAIYDTSAGLPPAA